MRNLIDFAYAEFDNSDNARPLENRGQHYPDQTISQHNIYFAMRILVCKFVQAKKTFMNVI